MDTAALLESYRQKVAARDEEICELHKLLAQRTRERDEALERAAWAERELEREVDL